MPLERNAMQTVLDGWIERCQRSNQSDKESAADCRLVYKRVGHGDETYAVEGIGAIFNVRSKNREIKMFA